MVDCRVHFLKYLIETKVILETVTPDPALSTDKGLEIWHIVSICDAMQLDIAFIPDTTLARNHGWLSQAPEPSINFAELSNTSLAYVSGGV